MHIAQLAEPHPSLTGVYRRPRMPFSRSEVEALRRCMDLVSEAVADRKLKLEAEILRDRQA